MRYIIIATAAASLVSLCSHTEKQWLNRTKLHTLPEVKNPVNNHAVIDRAQLDCLATMIYGEARGESRQGQVAVAYTAMNRAVKKSICDVVLAPKQYSVFNNNPGLRAAAMSHQLEPDQKNLVDRSSWNLAQAVAYDVYTRKVADPTDGATFYVADRVMKAKGYRYPKWTRQYKVVAVIENHRFFKNQPKGKKSVDRQMDRL